MTIKIQKYKHLFKESSWILIGQIATIIGSLVLVRVLTEYLDPVDYGILALGMTIAGLMNQVVTGASLKGSSVIFQ